MGSDTSRSGKSPDKGKSSRKLKTAQKKTARGRRPDSDEAQVSPASKRGARGAGAFGAQLEIEKIWEAIKSI